MRHLYQVHLIGLCHAINMILKNYAQNKMDINNITFSQNVYLRVVEELNINNKSLRHYSKVFMLPLSIDPQLLPFTVVIDVNNKK